MRRALGFVMAWLWCRWEFVRLRFYATALWALCGWKWREAFMECVRQRAEFLDERAYLEKFRRERSHLAERGR